jgi:PKHD-type hydroxylase
MVLTIPGVLTAAQVADFRQALEGAEWADGKATAGYLSSRAKDNAQLPEAQPLTRKLGNAILAALDGNQLFIAAALPLKVLPPLFNRYAGGQSYGSHIDGAVQPLAGTHHRVRTDLSATLFLSDPADYDGGELIIGGEGEGEGEDQGEGRRIKLPAGDLVLYGAGTVHRVTPVTRGVRLAAFFWVQSMVRDAVRRELLFDLDRTLQQLGAVSTNHDPCVRLAGIYHNLLRQWADT